MTPGIMKLYKRAIRSLERKLGVKSTPSIALEERLMKLELRAAKRDGKSAIQH